MVTFCGERETIHDIMVNLIVCLKNLKNWEQGKNDKVVRFIFKTLWQTWWFGLSNCKFHTS